MENNQLKKQETTKNSSTSPIGFDKLKFLHVRKKEKKVATEQDVTTWRGYFIDLLLRLQKADITGLGAQLAFFFLLSFFPLIIFLVTLLPYLNLDEAQVFRFLENYAPTEVYILIEGTISDILISRNGGLLSVGIIGTIWSASYGIDAIVKSLNKSYNLEETRPYFIVRGLSIVFTFLMIVLLLVVLILPVFGQQIGTILFSYFGYEEDFIKLWNNIRWWISPLIIFFILVVLYWFIPNTKVFLKSVFPGAFFATIGWILASLGFSYYVSSFGNYSSTYGSIGGIIVLMLWLYWSGIILLVGGQINAAMQKRKIALEKKAGSI